MSENECSIDWAGLGLQDPSVVTKFSFQWVVFKGGWLAKLIPSRFREGVGCILTCPPMARGNVYLVESTEGEFKSFTSIEQAAEHLKRLGCGRDS
jgi:hypothetical protein